MNLFHINKGNVASIEPDPLKLEKEMQALIEANLEDVFALKLVASELKIHEFRLDTLAFDEDNSAFVIIEYKNGYNYSVIDQGYSYLSVMMNNKSDFILEYNERMSASLRRNQIDWSSSRILFIAPSFNRYQKNSVNFKNMPYELWEMKKFVGGVISLSQHQSSSTESFDSGGNNKANSDISDVLAEIAVITESDHVAKLSADMRALWYELREQLDVFPDTSFYAKKSYVGFKRDNKVICFIHFRQSNLRIDIAKGEKSPDGTPSKKFFELYDPKGIARDYSWTYKTGSTGHNYQIFLKDPNNLKDIIGLIEQKYDRL